MEAGEAMQRRRQARLRRLFLEANVDASTKFEFASAHAPLPQLSSPGGPISTNAIENASSEPFHNRGLGFSNR